MRISINGQASTIPEGCTLARLIEHLDIRGRIAIEVNGAIVPRSQFQSFCLGSEDRIEIVRAIGGG